MSQQHFEQPTNQLQPMMNDYNGLTGEQIEAANRTALNLQLTKFMYHAWPNIDNSYVGGCRGHLKYRWLKRLTLIPLYPWPYKKIVNRTAGHVSGDIIAGNVRVGTRQEQRTVSIESSEKFILKAYGKMSGIRTLESLTTSDDVGRQEAFLLFHAAMEIPIDPATRRPSRNGLRGIDCPLEDLVDTNDRGVQRQGFLTIAAPAALQFVFEHGVEVPDYLFYAVDKLGRRVQSPLFDDRLYHFRESAFTKGLKMVKELKSVTETAYNLMAGPAGVLVRSRNQINAARMGQQDSKMQKDPLDLWGERECPSFSWETDVDRMRTAQQPVLDELRRLGRSQATEAAPVAANNEEQLQLLREDRAMLLEQNERLMRQQEEVNERLKAIEAASLSTAAENAGTADNEIAGDADQTDDTSAPLVSATTARTKGTDKPKR